MRPIQNARSLKIPSGHETGFSAFRGLADLLLLILVSAVLANLVADTTGLMDFVEYWSASRLNLSGGNPYDPTQLFPLQLEARPSQQVVIMMWNPPWTLGYLALLGRIDYGSAELVWAFANLLIVMVCSLWLWRYFGGSRIAALGAAVASLGFPAAIIATRMGQISPWLLMGLCGFLHFERQDKPFRAGVLAALTLVKPHALLLFWSIVVLQSIRNRRFGTLLGAAVTTGFALALALAINPAVVHQYITAVRDYPPDYVLAPTLGVVARLLLGWESSWPQILPSFIGATMLGVYWWNRRDGWLWKEQISLIVVICVLTSAYGWLFDHVVLLVPTIQVARWLLQYKSFAVAAASGLCVTALVLTLVMWPYPLLEHPTDYESAKNALAYALSRRNSIWQVVVAPLFFAGFLGAFLTGPARPRMQGARGDPKRLLAR